MRADDVARREERPGGRITVDTGALRRNWETLRGIAGTDTAAVVKADAYGTGIAVAVPALAAAGCTTFFVATPEEGARARAAAPRARIFLLSGLFADSAAFILENGLTPVLNTLEDVALWRDTAARAGRRLPAALHVDTGMTRLGLGIGDLDRLDAMPAEIDLQLVMSHLASADDPADPRPARQNARFAEIAARFPGVPRSLANSAAVLRRQDLCHDLARPGIALYGAEALTGAPVLQTVVTCEARIVQIRDVSPGDEVGYGAAFTVEKPGRIAIVAAGYADGYMRAAGGGVPMRGLEPQAFGHAAGRRVPLAGRVSMDLSAFDVSDVPEGALRQGDRIELFGPHIPVDEVARAAGTIGYELLTSLSRRFQRVAGGGTEG